MTSPWLYSRKIEFVGIILPSFASVLIAALLAPRWNGSTGVPLWAWVGLILCIDVTHVYSTLYKTYWNPIERKKFSTHLVLIPLMCWLVGAFLYFLGSDLFWRVLAYIAVFHFSRQQYGFLRLYSRGAVKGVRWIDQGIIYCATGYPILYWHTHLQTRQFHWFVDGDFVSGLPPTFDRVGALIYLAFAVLYCATAIQDFKKQRQWNWPRNLIVLGTALSWYFGIIYFNGDLLFTLVNVVSHGVPYMVLVWLYGRRHTEVELQEQRKYYSLAWVPVLYLAILTFAFFEEGLWAGFVWREHFGIFSIFANLPVIRDHETLTWLVPLLSLPQTTHYVLDGFIWKGGAWGERGMV